MSREFNLRFVGKSLLAGWRTIVIVIGLALLLAVAILAGARPIYSVKMIVLPAPSDRGELGGSSGAAGSLTTLLGFGGGNIDNSYVRYQRLMSSPAVAQRLQNKYHLLQYVYADRWDKKTQTWRSGPAGLRGFFFGWLFELAHVPISSPPDATTLASYIGAQIEVIPSPTSDIVNVTMNSPDVAFATHLMLMAHEQTNALLRDQMARRAREQVAYLQTKLSQTSVSDYRATLLSLLSAQEKTLMLTETDASFAAEIVSPPVSSSVPISPRPILTLAVAILVGFLLGSIIVIFAGHDWYLKIPPFWGSLWKSGRHNRPN